VRILSGALRGRTLPYRASSGLRPTGDKVRKALFDTLAGALEDRNVLDLFGGTGALGFEALSGGAARVTFVEKDRVRSERILAAAQALGVAERVRVMRADALEALKRLAAERDAFDIVFLDPPYDSDLGAAALAVLGASPLVGDGSIVILESRKGASASVPGRLRRLRERVYGDTTLIFYGVEIDPASGG
jgi:16S rRNA (guanine966-N2)-methyltransferase